MQTWSHKPPESGGIIGVPGSGGSRHGERGNAAGRPGSFQRRSGDAAAAGSGSFPGSSTQRVAPPSGAVNALRFSLTRTNTHTRAGSRGGLTAGETTREEIMDPQPEPASSDGEEEEEESRLPPCENNPTVSDNNPERRRGGGGYPRPIRTSGTGRWFHFCLTEIHCHH